MAHRENAASFEYLDTVPAVDAITREIAGTTELVSLTSTGGLIVLPPGGSWSAVVELYV